jgi:hypothetical protein
MVKKILLLVGIFFICLLAGVFSARGFWSKPYQAETPPSSMREQSTYLIFQVDELTQETPQLVSAWALFLVKKSSEPTYLTVMTLYPTLTSKNETYPSFQLTSEKLLDPGFKNRISAQLDLAINGYIILDQQAASILTTWLTDSPIVPTNKIPETLKEKQDFLNNFQVIWQDICFSLSNEAIEDFQDSDLRSLEPDHLVTDLSVEKTPSNWRDLLLSIRPLTCEILPIP